MKEIKPNSTQSILESVFVKMDALHATAEKAEQNAHLAWAGIALLAKRHHIQAATVCKRYGVEKSYFNMIARGATLIDTGKLNKNGVPILGLSAFAVDRIGKDGKTVTDKDGNPLKDDFTVQKLSRLSSLGDAEEITKFLAEKNITPATSQADLIKALAEYKKPAEEATEATTKEAAEEATEETTEDTASVEIKKLTAEGEALQKLLDAVGGLVKLVSSKDGKTAIINHAREIVKICESNGLKLATTETLNLEDGENSENE